MEITPFHHTLLGYNVYYAALKKVSYFNIYGISHLPKHSWSTLQPQGNTYSHILRKKIYTSFTCNPYLERARLVIAERMSLRWE